jgi:hypothetical protein
MGRTHAHTQARTRQATHLGGEGRLRDFSSGGVQGSGGGLEARRGARVAPCGALELREQRVEAHLVL